MKIAGLFLIMLVAIAIAEGLDSPGLSIWHSLLVVAIVACAVERGYSAFLLKGGQS